MSVELEKTYEPEQTEKNVSEIWLSRGYFHANTSATLSTGASGDGRAVKPYTIVIPPPNVTAPLHLGHALNNTLQDILIRFRRMQKYNTLWLPGTDHAGIATQTVVEKRLLAEQGKKRTDFQRDEFIAHVQAWKDEYEATIINQLKAMGCSCDWARTRFTMDPVCAKAVRAAFFQLFKDGLIYRGKRLVNWDPATQTVLADDEVEHETVKGHFWYMRYPLVEPVEVPCGTAFQAVDEVVRRRKGAYLPHWTQAGSTYAVTFRLADSLPAEVLERWHSQRDRFVQQAGTQGREPTPKEQRELTRLYCDHVESFLNAGHGRCYLRDPRIAELVQNALKHFDGKRYDLIVWVIMPNHVHAVIRPRPGEELPTILHSWKSYTANKANKLLGRNESFWQDEYYDHIIREEEDFNHQVDYILNNPAKAGLENWAWVGVSPDAIGKIHGQDARATITHVTVATTRPETMLGDTAVAMNPNDPRAKHLLGKMVRLPIVGRIIPIIADEHVVLPDPDGEDEKAKFSTGFLKVTPAHDPDDWEIGQRNSLPIVNVMAPDGSISDKYGWTDWEDIKNPDVENLIGMDRFEAREAVVEWFRTEKLLDDVREYTHEVGHSYRSHVPIEPYLSDQWYIAVKEPIPSLVTRDLCLEEDFIRGTDVPVNSLAGLALKPLLDGRLRFIPERYAKTYQAWLENLRDWPISRQLWWGHRIPIWKMELKSANLSASEYSNPTPIFETALKDLLRAFGREDIGFRVCASKSELCTGYVCLETPDGDDILNLVGKFLFSIPDGIGAIKPGQAFPRIKRVEGITGVPERRKACSEFEKHVQVWNRDEDVLDTWFSSALWPFSTMGWPDDTDDLKTFYPGDVLCTAREIITLWVSRMLMMGQYCIGDIPFSDVFIHAMIQDGEGRKMSKSLGNGIDPLVAINSHGADAMRFTLASMTTQTQDVRMPVKKMKLPDGRTVNTSPKFDIGRNFCNKLWNASRFALMNLEGVDPAGFDKEKMTITDRWILSRLAQTISAVTESLDEFKYSEPLAQIYRFFWNDFCDWYLEWAKPRMQDKQQRQIAQNVLAFVLDQSLRLLHPFVPFITEGIFQKLNEIAPVRKLQGLAKAEKSDALVIAQWPGDLENLRDEDAEKQITLIQSVIRAIRDVRSEYNKPQSELLLVSAKLGQENVKVLSENEELILQLAGVKEFRAGAAIVKPPNSAVTIADTAQIYVHDMIDPVAEQRRLEKQKKEVEKARTAVETRLANKNFLTKAKPEVVAQARDRLAELTEQLKAIEKHLAELTA